MVWSFCESRFANFWKSCSLTIDSVLQFYCYGDLDMLEVFNQVGFP